MKTIKQIADEVGVDKQKVYRYIKKNQIKEVHQKYINEALQKNGVKYYDETVEILIKQAFCEDSASNEVHRETHQNHINEAVFDALLKRFETVEKELEDKNNQIEYLHKLLDQEQQLRMVTEQKIQLIEQQEETTEDKKAWWKFWK